jgi:hypothetical protein
MNNSRALEASMLQEFPMVSWGPNLVLVCLFNQGCEHSQLPHKCNSQSGSALGSYWVSSLAFSPPFVRVCFTPKHIFSLMGPYTSHFVMNPMLRLWNQRPCTSTSMEPTISWHTTLPSQALNLTKHSKTNTSQNTWRPKPHKTTQNKCSNK